MKYGLFSRYVVDTVCICGLFLFVYFSFFGIIIIIVVVVVVVVDLIIFPNFFLLGNLHLSQRVGG